jgi:lipid-binding SYLF domain-containing protein
MIERLKLKLKCLVLLMCASFFIAACASSNPPKLMVAEQLLGTSVDAVERFRVHLDLKKFTHELENAAAVIIMPSVIKAGFFVGGEIGNGVLLKRNGNSNWSLPAYFTLAAASFGLQFGIQDTAIILVIRNVGALNSILDHQGKLGADAGATIGTEGLGLEASTTGNLSADIVAFASPNAGGFMGVSIEGAVLATRHDLNEALYGKGAKPKIILDGHYTNLLADGLRRALAKR